MAEAMDGCSPSRLFAGDRRQESESELLEWWSNYRSKPERGVGSIEVRDKSDGSNRYGIVPWDVSLRGERASVDVSVNEPQAVSVGHTYIRRPITRRQQLRQRRNCVRQGPVV